MSASSAPAQSPVLRVPAVPKLAPWCTETMAVTGARTAASPMQRTGAGTGGRPQRGARNRGKRADQRIPACRSPVTAAGADQETPRTPVTVGQQLPPERVVPAGPVEYCFDAARSKRDAYAWPGLARFGPFSRDTFARPTPRGSSSYSRRPRKARLRNSSGTCATGYPITREAGFARTFGLVNRASPSSLSRLGLRRPRAIALQFWRRCRGTNCPTRPSSW